MWFGSTCSFLLPLLYGSYFISYAFLDSFQFVFDSLISHCSLLHRCARALLECFFFSLLFPVEIMFPFFLYSSSYLPLIFLFSSSPYALLLATSCSDFTQSFLFFFIVSVFHLLTMKTDCYPKRRHSSSRTSSSKSDVHVRDVEELFPARQGRSAYAGWGRGAS